MALLPFLAMRACRSVPTPRRIRLRAWAAACAGFRASARARSPAPAGRAPGARRGAEHLREARTRAVHFALGPSRVARRDEVLPAHMVPAMHADFEAGIAHRSHAIGAAPADVRPGQHHAVKERAYA